MNELVLLCDHASIYIDKMYFCMLSKLNVTGYDVKEMQMNLYRPNVSLDVS